MATRACQGAIPFKQDKQAGIKACLLRLRKVPLFLAECMPKAAGHAGSIGLILHFRSFVTACRLVRGSPTDFF